MSYLFGFQKEMTRNLELNREGNYNDDDVNKQSTFVLFLLSASQGSKCLLYISSVNVHNNPER